MSTCLLFESIAETFRWRGLMPEDESCLCIEEADGLRGRGPMNDLKIIYVIIG